MYGQNSETGIKVHFNSHFPHSLSRRGRLSIMADSELAMKLAKYLRRIKERKIVRGKKKILFTEPNL